MIYFDELPIVSVQKNGTVKSFRNILTRANIKKTIISNPLLYYQYTMMDGDTLDAMASKYYGTTSRFWFFSYGNEKLDPQWDFGMDSNIFLDYLRHKYCIDNKNFEKYLKEKLHALDISESIINERLKEYTDEDVLQYCVDTEMFYYKVITKIDRATGNKNEEIIYIGEEDYSENVPVQKTFVMYKYEIDGKIITSRDKPLPEEKYGKAPTPLITDVTESYGKKSIYDYELDENHNKRITNVIKDSYSRVMEETFSNIMRS